MEIFNFLHTNQLDLSRLKFGKIVFLSKTKGAGRLQQYMTFYVLNFRLQIFTKVAINSLMRLHADHVVQ